MTGVEFDCTSQSEKTRHDEKTKTFTGQKKKKSKTHRVPRKSWKNKRQEKISENATSATNGWAINFFCGVIIRSRLDVFCLTKRKSFKRSHNVASWRRDCKAKRFTACRCRSRISRGGGRGQSFKVLRLKVPKFWSGGGGRGNPIFSYVDSALALYVYHRILPRPRTKVVFFWYPKKIKNKKIKKFKLFSFFFLLLGDFPPYLFPAVPLGWKGHFTISSLCFLSDCDYFPPDSVPILRDPSLITYLIPHNTTRLLYFIFLNFSTSYMFFCLLHFLNQVILTEFIHPNWRDFCRRSK